MINSYFICLLKTGDHRHRSVSEFPLPCLQFSRYTFLVLLYFTGFDHLLCSIPLFESKTLSTFGIRTYVQSYKCPMIANYYACMGLLINWISYIQFFSLNDAIVVIYDHKVFIRLANVGAVMFKCLRIFLNGPSLTSLCFCPVFFRESSQNLQQINVKNVHSVSGNGI